MKIKVGTLSLNVLESGAGEPTLLFLHYWGAPRGLGTALSKSFAQRFGASPTINAVGVNLMLLRTATRFQTWLATPRP
jgi:hypothetical protein